jgi:hypothetical protein
MESELNYDCKVEQPITTNLSECCYLQDIYI